VRTAVVGSGLVHLALVVVLLIVRTSATMIVPGPDVVQVSLLDPSQMATITPVAPPQPKVEREPEKETVAPTEVTGVKLQPEKKKPQPKQPDKQPEPAPPQLPAPALPYATVGAAGLSGALATDTNFEFTYYLTLVRNKVASAWAPPAGLASGNAPQAVVYFRIQRDGTVSGARIETGSGVEFFDRSALRAVQLSDPLPPLPLGFSGGDLGVHFGFRYVAP